MFTTNPIGYVFLVLFFALLFTGVVSRRLQLETYTFHQGWWLTPSVAIVPKSPLINGYHFVVVSLFFLGLELRWFAWRWANNG